VIFFIARTCRAWKRCIYIRVKNVHAKVFKSSVSYSMVVANFAILGASFIGKKISLCPKGNGVDLILNK
jgi:hypothetical protein